MQGGLISAMAQDEVAAQAIPNGAASMDGRGIVILTGAGISRESGLATFRDADGIWAKVRIEDVATPEAFARDPTRVQAFYDARRVQLRDPAIQPNAAHHALARLTREYPRPCPRRHPER